MSTKLTAVITEAARFLAAPGRSCKLPGRKMVAVGQGDGSGGAEDVEASSCAVVESCAVAVASIDEAKRRNIFCFDSENNIVLYCMGGPARDFTAQVGKRKAGAR
jgi:hypothetical protein